MAGQRPLVSMIPPEDAAKILREGKVGRDFVVLDVRDDDFRGGHIKNAINVPSQSLDDEKLESLVAQFRDVPNVIVHCSLSQQRGPIAAKAYADAIARTPGGPASSRPAANIIQPPTESKPSEPPSSLGSAESQRIQVLKGGFQRFQALYHDDPELIEGWDKLVWKPFED